MVLATTEFLHTESCSPQLISCTLSPAVLIMGGSTWNINSSYQLVKGVLSAHQYLLAIMYEILLHDHFKLYYSFCTRAGWTLLQDLILSRSKKLSGAYEIHKFNRDAKEILGRLQVCGLF